MSENIQKQQRLYELVEILKRANLAYEQENDAIISDYEYDKLYDELVLIENELNIYPDDSPVRTVGHQVVSSLKKVSHQVPLLSLNKTKELQKLESFLNNNGISQSGVLSWKLDGLTIVLKYEGGILITAVTRGNGIIGEDVSHNARFFNNIPKNIEYKGELLVRGEAIISHSEFERINESLNEQVKYKNPRNLCSGTIRQLDSKESSKRTVEYYAFSLLKGPQFALKSQALSFLAGLGFVTAKHKVVDENSVAYVVDEFKNELSQVDFATDGLVLTYDDIAFSISLGVTSKFPRDSIAFKWADEIATTRLIDISWHASRTGLINPIAIFEPVELEGTTVSRASLHNLSIVEGLKLGVGDEISVYKANMIIPQVSKNFTESNTAKPPNYCPICSKDTIINEENGVKTLHCKNENCKAKILAAIVHYASRDAMNIEGLSKQTIEKFMEQGYIKNFVDIYSIYNYEKDISALKGFGKKSCAKILSAIENSKIVGMANFIYALGIENVGLSLAKLLCHNFGYNLELIRTASSEAIAEIGGFGDIIAGGIQSYFSNSKNALLIDSALKYIIFKDEARDTSDIGEPKILQDKTFVITGDLIYFTNRKELAAKIEELGGKITSAVSKNTSYLINNNAMSTSSKNKKARELSVKIISEQEFLNLLE